MKLLYSLTTLVVTLSPLVHAETNKPNIIFIMADDLGYGDLGCYGSPKIKTPHIDQLAADGVRCTDFHSNGAVCSPTRAALMTGQYQQRSGIGGVISAARHRYKGLALEQLTIAEAMKKQGYSTAMFGKWHLGYAAKFNPIHQGFDEFKGFVSGNIDYHNHIDQEGHQDWWVQDKIQDEKGYLTDLVTQHGVDYIKRQKAKPFFLILNHAAPHYPIQGRNERGVRVTGKPYSKQPRNKLKDPKATYQEMIEVMDEGVGKIIAQLEKSGVSNNTLVIFTSDNGPAPIGSTGGLRGKKGTLFEGGHRVCGIFKFPGVLPKGSTCDRTILTMDMLSTFVAASGGETKKEWNQDGINILPILKGQQKEEVKRDTLFWRHGQAASVRAGKWKLVRIKKKILLFNLQDDLAEKHNLAKKHPDMVNDLLAELNDWEKEVLNK